MTPTRPLFFASNHRFSDDYLRMTHTITHESNGGPLAGTSADGAGAATAQPIAIGKQGANLPPVTTFATTPPFPGSGHHKAGNGARDADDQSVRRSPCGRFPGLRTRVLRRVRERRARLIQVALMLIHGQRDVDGAPVTIYTLHAAGTSYEAAVAVAVQVTGKEASEWPRSSLQG